MKILFLLPFLNVGGMERKAVLLAKELIERGHVVHVAQFVAGGKLEAAMRATGADIITIDRAPYGPPHRIRIPGLRRAQRWIGLRRLLRTGRYDVVYSFDYQQNIYAASAAYIMRTRVVWGVEGRSQIQGSIGRWLERRTVSLADLIITVSEDMRKYCLDRGFPPQHTIVIDNGVDTESFRIERSWVQSSRNELGVEEHDVLIGMLGRLDPVKNVEGFLQAAAAIARSDTRVRFSIVGPHKSLPYSESLVQVTFQLGIQDRVIWSGTSPNPERYLNALDVYVSASHSEGLSLALLEAMSCGRVCVATDVGDSERVLGNMGFIVPPGDAPAMARAIIQALGSDLQTRPEEIRQRVVDQFSASRQAERTEAALLALVSATHGEASP